MRRLYYSDDEFGNALGDALRDYREVPPVGNWRSINARLDSRKRRRYTGWIVATASVFVVVLLGASIYVSTEPARELLRERMHVGKVSLPITEPQSHPTIPTLAPTSQNNSVVASQSRGTVNKFSNVPAARNHHVLRINQPVSSEVVTANVLVNEEARLTEPMTILSRKHAVINTDEWLDDVPMLHEIMLAEKPTVDLPPVVKPGCSPFYFGFNLNPQHNLLLSQSAQHNDRLKYSFSPGASYGVSVGYRMCRAFSAEVEALFSTENQRYRVASQSNTSYNATPQWRMVSKEITMQYFRVPVLLKYRLPQNASRRSVCDRSWNIVAGADYGRFISGNNHQGLSEEAQLEDYVQRDDFQVLLGVDRTNPLGHDMLFNYGLRFGYGVDGIGAKPVERVGPFYQPHTSSVAITLSLQFTP